MKRILICAGVLVLTAACGHEGDFDATGTFEATEVVVSAEAAGRILRFDAEEGDLLTAGCQGRGDRLRTTLPAEIAARTQCRVRPLEPPRHCEAGGFAARADRQAADRNAAVWKIC